MPDVAVSPSVPVEKTGSDRIQFSFPRKWLIPALVALVIFGVLLLGWQTGYLQNGIENFNRATIEVTVSDAKTSKPLVGVELKIGETSQRTNENGQAQFILKAKSYQLAADLPGYQPIESSLTLKRGINNPQILQLEPLPPAKVQLSGVIRDYIDQGPVEGVTIKLADLDTKTREDGSFTLEDVATGQFDLVLSHPDYSSKKISVNITTETASVGPYFLVPRGQAVFVSNRDGYKAVYSANLDGSSAEKLWLNKPKTNDYNPVLSPDKSKIFFYSDRDQEKDDYGYIRNKLYLFEVGNNQVSKLSDDSYYYSIAWLPDSRHIIYQTYDYGDHSESFIKKIDTLNKKTTLLVSNVNFKHDTIFNSYLSYFTLSHNGQMFAVYASVSEPYRDKSGLYLGFTDGSDFKRISTRLSISNVKFSDDDNKVSFDAYEDNKKKSFVINLASLEEKEVSSDQVLSAVGYEGYFVPQEVKSPNKKLIALTDHRDGKTDLYFKNADGTDERKLTNIGGVTQIHFSGNSRYIVFSVQKESESAALVVGLNKGNEPLKISDITDGNSLAGIID